jgi:hypothetical protein
MKSALESVLFCQMGIELTRGRLRRRLRMRTACTLAIFVATLS